MVQQIDFVNQQVISISKRNSSTFLVLLKNDKNESVFQTYNTNLQIISQASLSQNVLQASAIEGTPIIAATILFNNQFKFNFYELLDSPMVFKQIRVASSAKQSIEYVESSFFQAIYLGLRPKLAALIPCVTTKEFQQKCLIKEQNQVWWILTGLHLHKGGQQISYIEYNVKVGAGHNIMIEVSKLKTLQQQVKICKILPLNCTTNVQNKLFNTFLTVSIGGQCFLYNYDKFVQVWQKQLFQGVEFINAVNYSESSILISNADELICLTNQSVITDEYLVNQIINQLISRICPYLAQVQNISENDCNAMLLGSYFMQYKNGQAQQELVQFFTHRFSENITSITTQGDNIIIGCSNNQLAIFSKQKLSNMALYNTYVAKYNDVIDDIRSQLTDENRPEFDQIIDQFMGYQPIIIDLQNKQQVQYRPMSRSELNNKIIQRTLQNEEVSDTIGSIEEEINKNQLSLLRNSEIQEDISLKTTQQVIELGQQLVQSQQSLQQSQQNVQQSQSSQNNIQNSQQSVQQQNTNNSQIQILQSQLNMAKQDLQQQSQLVSQLSNENSQLQQQTQKLIDSLPSYQENYDIQNKLNLLQSTDKTVYNQLLKSYSIYDWFYYFLIQSNKLNIFNQNNINQYIIAVQSLDQLYEELYDNYQIFIVQLQQFQSVELQLKSQSKNTTYTLQSLFTLNRQFTYQNNQFIDVDNKQLYTPGQLVQILYGQQVYLVYNMNMQYYFEQNSLQWVNSVGKIIRELIQQIQSPKIIDQEIQQTIQRCLQYLQVKSYSNDIYENLQQLEAACISNQAKSKSLLESSMKQSILKSTVVPTTYKRSHLSDMLQISATCVFAIAILILFTLIIQDSL